MSAFEVARANMVESQLRPNGVTDRRILAAMAGLARERFVPAPQRGLAYMDEDVRIAPGLDGGPDRFLMEPMTLARLIQLAGIRPSDAILEVGCASGYGTAILASLGRSVLGVEENPTLAALARANLEALGLGNATVVHGPLAAGVRSQAPFDVIVVEGRVPGLPNPLIEQLKDDGRLVAVIGLRALGKATLATRHAGALSARAAFDAAVAPLPGFPDAHPAFVF